ncbi:VC0807 family protein [Kitasatospora sp. NBC_01266]|uniref:VC0807 family protein n=1 Tax=Kitasatospora sp. NBC_01266 TaxID=2903572 RepID=UPI002E329DCE|nr:VC0807 family protein [Kitasatospora sp. NBC_01266]
MGNLVEHRAGTATAPTAEPTTAATAEPTPEATATPDAAAPDAAAPDAAAAKARAAAGRRKLIQGLVFELGLPLGGYYLLTGLGMSQWAALVISGVLVVPWMVYGMVKRGRVEVMPVFTLVLLAAGTLMSLVTGSARVLLIRDSWLFGVVGLWVLGTLATQRPFMLTAARSIVAAKIGEAGAQVWLDRWHTEPVFRHQIRLLTAVWGGGFLLDAAIRVVFACTLPIGAVPLVNSLQWLVVLGGLFGFHFWYITRNGLKV